MSQIYLALIYFILNATSVVFLGSQRLLSSKQRSGEISLRGAVEMPIIGSAVLFSLYLAYKYLPVNIINLLISMYLSLGATYALATVIKQFIKPRLITGILCVLTSIAYFWTNHWILNNILAFCLGICALESISIGTFKASFILLCLLFLYDIFWVFGTPVMLSVASQIRGPVLLQFPQTLFGDHEKKSMLGLGDIVVPGLFISQTLIFSQKCVKRGNLYFFVSLVAYVCGLCMTMAVMTVFKHGQPALLYIVPWLLISFTVAVQVCGDGQAALKFSSSDFIETIEVDQNVDIPFLQFIMDGVKELFGFAPEEESSKTPKRRKSSEAKSSHLRIRKKSNKARSHESNLSLSTPTKKNAQRTTIKKKSKGKQ